MIPQVNERFVLTKCNFFAANQIWPRKSRMNPDGWLNNFDTGDRRSGVKPNHDIRFELVRTG